MLQLKHRLKERLERLDMTASQLARRSSVPKQTISHWLNGGQPRQIQQLRKVAQALGQTIDELCFGDSAGKKELEKLSDGEWITGCFEVKMRRIPK